MRLVVALGGNALLRRGEPLDLERQRRNVAWAATALRPLAEAHDLVVSHGNGPQVGLLALQAAAVGRASDAPLDILDAESEGMIGYLIMLELQSRLPSRRIVTLLTRVVVDPDDPAFATPTKPVGPVYSAAEAREIRRREAWALAPDGDGLRRVVPSPAPQRIVELETIADLTGAGTIVICAGGGGIPVVEAPSGGHRGIEAVIDKDATTALLAEGLSADALLLLTDVDAVYERWPTRPARRIKTVSPETLAGFAFETGSMGPKAAAAARFASRTGRSAGIGALDEAAEVLGGRRGTTVRRLAPLEYHRG